MISRGHMAAPEDDLRHAPGPGSLPLLNESYWFAFYDPQVEVGVTVRLGMHPNVQEGNLYLSVAHRGRVVHSITDVRASLPPWDERRLALHGYTIDIEEPLERFRLRYARESHAIDVVWQGLSPTYLYPYPPGTTADQVPRHIEHAGSVKGTVTVGNSAYAIDCLGHRDHSWGGERDWSKLPKWHYLSGEIDESFWFNAVRVSIAGSPQDIYLGGVWNGTEVMGLTNVKMDVRDTDGGTRQMGVDLLITDERGDQHHVVGEEVLAIATAWFGSTCVRDGFTRYRYGDRLGYGILELGYTEDR